MFVRHRMCDAERMERVEREWVAGRWPVPTAAMDKYSRGVVGIVAGSEAYPGAAVLACSGALRAGTGVVHYVGPVRAQDLVLHRRPEVIVHTPHAVREALPHADAWVLGPGVAAQPEQDAVVTAVLASGIPVVADAGALGAATAAWVGTSGSDSRVMTPHERELVRVLRAVGVDVAVDQIGTRRAHWAALAATTVGATVVLKGAVTVVARPDGTVTQLPAGPAWLATAGTGDVLAGVTGALMACGVGAADAAVMAAWIHARAAERASGGGPLTALDVAEALPATIAALVKAVGQVGLEPTTDGL